MASTLNPPMFDLKLPSALTSHFEPRVQQGLIYRNLQSTQNVLAFLAKLQGLGDQGYHSASTIVAIQAEDLRESRITLGTEIEATVPYVRQQGDRQNRRYSV
jgi:hypothetical protein